MNSGQSNSDDICILNHMKDEDGFTSHVYALVMLLSVALVFSLATSQWILQKSASIQTVADTATLSASNTVNSYRQITQVADAVIFTVGFTGVICIGVGFVVSCIPTIRSFGVELVNFGVKTIRARNKAAEQVYRVLEAIEAALPLIIGLSAHRTISAQSTNNLIYHGFALGFPLVSESDFPDKNDINVADDTEQKAKSLADNTEKLEKHKKIKAEAQEEGWYADCGNPDHNLRERAGHLAGLSDSENPMYETPDLWTFAAPIQRSRNYYQKRYANENTDVYDVDDIRQAWCRKYFYSYAYELVSSAYYIETEDSFSLYMPYLPATKSEFTDSPLYTDQSWLSDGTYLHAYSGCPEINGALSSASLSEIGHGIEVCPHCKLSIEEQSLVSRLTTVNVTGYEYWYKKVVEASERYEKASKELKKLEEKRIADEKEISGRYKEIVDQFSLKRVKFKPPGCMGCVALVYREEGAEVPNKLAGPFAERETLPRGYAIAGSALAPDKDEQNHMLNAFASALIPDKGLGPIASACLDIWGDMLVGYGKKVDSIDGGLDRVSQNLGESTGGNVHRFKSLLNKALEGVGLDPVDISVYKPTLIQSYKIIDTQTEVDIESIYKWFELVPTKEYELTHFTLEEFGIEIEDGQLKICELNLPFLSDPIKLTVPIGVLWPGS